jgi:hypothetical protein
MHEKKRLPGKWASGIRKQGKKTRPGELLKSRYPPRAYYAGAGKKPSFVEIDTVRRCGTSDSGEYGRMRWKYREHASWRGFLIFVRGEDADSDDGGKLRITGNT